MPAPLATRSDYLHFWGKAQPSASPPAPQFHPIAYHLLDVAAVVEAILTVRPQALRTAVRLLRVPGNDAVRLLVTLAALHDLGKFAPTFQAKVPTLWPTVLGPFAPERILPGRHTEDGYVLWDGVLAEEVTERIWPGAEDALFALAPAVFGHHGRPVGEMPRGIQQRFSDPAVAAALQCADAVVGLLCSKPLRAPPLASRDARVASWWVAGLMTTADWIGSGVRWFPYTAPLSEDATLNGYWQRARLVALQAVHEAGLAAPAPAPRRNFAQLTRLKGAPTPAQQWAEDVVLPEGPCLVVIEDVTGAGKTEAAQMIVHRLLAACRAAGAYWAMPTQATANAMYDRQARLFDRLYTEGATPSLVLAHGQQRFHDGFRHTVLAGAVADSAHAQSQGGGRAGDEEELPGTIACAAFLADDRRAALLADIGAGTVDQAMLGVLPSRFNTMRLFGLADKVLVVDEAHAYDAYMGVELQVLLRFQAALGGCAVVLSATLPQAQRSQLVKAWVDGLNAGGWIGGGPTACDAVSLRSDAYPLATMVGIKGVSEQPLDTAPWSHRVVDVRLVHELDDALTHAVDASRAGAAVAWIRNTVDDCLDAAAQLREQGVEKVLVFHARFAQCDRQAREAEVMQRFGQAAAEAARSGWVLVATQVVEQSLDLDFDVMLSDLAPVDLLIQRAGRLWRHALRDAARPAGCVRELVVFSPPPNADPAKDWLGGAFKGTAAVYENAGILWRTVEVLARAKRIETPGGLRALIEDVYGSAEVPTGLLPIAQRAEGKEAGNAATALYGTLKVPHGYDASGEAWLHELRVPTRLGDPQTAVRLARVLADGRLAPWADVQSAWKAWALSEVKVSAARVPLDAAPLPEHAAAVERARCEWGRFEQELPLLPLAEVAPECWQGALVLSNRDTPVHLEYSLHGGLAFLAR